MSARFGVGLAVIASILGACNLIAGIPDKPGSGGAGGGGGAPVTCNVDDECDDQEPCTKDACGADKLCAHGALADGPAPDAVQKAGDCRTVMCHGGKSANEPDDLDTLDDGLYCTADRCFQGEPTHLPVPEDTVCELLGHTGRCNAVGECLVFCDVAKDCEAPNPCYVPSCVQGTCIFTPLPDGTPTPGVVNMPHDCHVPICLGGVDTNAVDDSDVPTTDNDCDLEVCTSGVPGNPPKLNNPPCSTFGGSLPGRCDAMGVCQQCVFDADCDGPADDCKHPACVNGACSEFHAPAGTVTTETPAQTLGDCQSIVCDGNGGTMLAYDAADPKCDNTICTTDVCAAPTTLTTYNSVPNGTLCGAGGSLSCFNGACVGCTINSQCPQASCNATTLTLAQTCNGMGSCEPPMIAAINCSPYLCTTAGCTTSCTSDAGCAQAGFGNYCTAAGTCTARLGNGAACTAENQCKSGFCVDGRCCNGPCTGTCEACSTAKKGVAPNGLCGAILNGTDPDAECTAGAKAMCGNDGSCDGAGACRKYASGTQCAAASCTGTVLNKPSSCNGSGTCTAPQPATQDCAPWLCSGGGCTSACAKDVQCAPGIAYCDKVGLGSCQLKKATGASCTRAAECVSGTCDVTGHCT